MRIRGAGLVVVLVAAATAGVTTTAGVTAAASPVRAMNERVPALGWPALGWIASASGLVSAVDPAPDLGDLAGVALNQPIVAAWGTPSGAGYWLAASDGGVFTFGDAGFHGGLGGTRLNAPIIAFAASPSGQGYWLLGADGGVFTFGDAAFFGSRSGSGRAVALVPTSTGQGYWIAMRDGRIYSHGDAPDLGQLAFAGLLDIGGLSRTSTDRGLWVIGVDGVVATLGDARPPTLGPADGEQADPAPPGRRPIVLAVRPDGRALVAGTATGAAPLPSGAVAVAGPGWGAVLGPPLLTRPPTGVALTFDDGPDPRWTPQLLDILDRYGVKATFFVLGSAARAHPDLVSEIARRGHRIGNHSDTHPSLTSIDPFLQYVQLANASAAIQGAGGTPTRCVRPPYGHTDPTVVSMVAAAGMVQEMWNVETRDYDRPGVTTIVRRATASLRPGRIILMHDGGRDRSQTLAAVPHIIEAVWAAGFPIEPVC